MNLKKILIILAVIAVVVVVAVYLMGQFEQTRPIADAATGLGNQAADYVKGNIPVVSAQAATITAAIGGLMVYKKSAETKVAAVTSSANNQISEINNEKEQLQSAFEAQKTKMATELEQAKTTASEATQKVTGLETEKTQLTAQLDAYKDLIKVNGVPADATDSRVIDAATPKVA